jgi:hypothetical protein
MIKQPTCSDCRFWWAYQGAGAGTGNCRRYAPKPFLGVEWQAAAKAAGDGIPDLGRQALWPKTLEADGCGEYAPRQERRGYV